MRKLIYLVIASAWLPRCAAAAPAQAMPAPAPPAWETMVTEPYKGKRDDIAFADAQHGWYGTGKGDLYATEDGGSTWQRVASKPGTFIRALGFLDAHTGFIGNVGTGYYPDVADSTPLYRTDDGGRTWTAVDLGGAKVAGICAIDILRTRRVHQGEMVPATIVTAAGRVGGPPALVRSEDGGRTWRVTDMSRWTSMILDVHFVDAQTGFVAGSSDADVDHANAQILMTRDGGATWRTVYQSSRPSELVWKMAWPSSKTGFGTVMSYDKGNVQKVVVRSVDGGQSWTELPLVRDGSAVEFGVGFADPKHGWIGTSIGGFETRDGGRSFAPAPIAKAANKFRIVAGEHGRTVFAIGTQVQRLRLADQPGSVPAAQADSSASPSSDVRRNSGG